MKLKTKYAEMFFDQILEQSCLGITLGGNVKTLPSGLWCKEISESKKTKRVLISVEYQDKNWFAWMDEFQLEEI